MMAKGINNVQRFTIRMCILLMMTVTRDGSGRMYSKESAVEKIMLGYEILVLAWCTSGVRKGTFNLDSELGDGDDVPYGTK